MQLEKSDLKQIKAIVDDSVNETKLELKKELNSQVKRLESKMETTKNEIILTISREVTDLSEINIAVMKKVDIIVEVDKRLTRVEEKVGIKGY